MSHNKKPVKTEKTNPVRTETVKPITEIEHKIANRVSKDLGEWDDIKEEDLIDYSLSVSRWLLPKPLKKLQDEKKFAFRWIERTDRRIDEVQGWEPPKQWRIVNRTRVPEIADLCDSGHGGIQAEDQILVMKPWHWHMVCQDAVLSKTKDQDASGTLKGKHGRTEDLEPGVVRTEYVADASAKIGGGDVVMASDS